MTSNPLAIRKDDPVSYIPPFERTGRPYAYDLCDHYNRTMSAAAKQNGAEWYVDNQGQVRLGQSMEWSARHAKETERTQEDERRQWMRHNWRANQG